METLRESHDPRRSPQLRADALTSICRWYLAAHDTGQTRHRGQPHLNVIVDIAALTDRDTNIIDHVRAEAAHGSRLSRATLERLACDAKISRIIMDGGPTDLANLRLLCWHHNRQQHAHDPKRRQ